jgi:hypothetical protein
MMRTIAPMMYRIEYIGTSFLSLDNSRSGPPLWGGAPVHDHWMLGSSRHTSGRMTSLESYGPRFSIDPGRDRVMSIPSSAERIHRRLVTLSVRLTMRFA